MTANAGSKETRTQSNQLSCETLNSLRTTTEVPDTISTFETSVTINEAHINPTTSQLSMHEVIQTMYVMVITMSPTSVNLTTKSLKVETAKHPKTQLLLDTATVLSETEPQNC